MFKAPSKVKNCPYTRKSNGIVLMPPTLIAELAAAVHDDDEWAIILQGERRNRGYEIEVTGYQLAKQIRSSGHVEVQQEDHLILPPDYATPKGEVNVVGVLHSHHSMGAFFSTTDTNKLNPRFPASIVIAEKKLQYLGFDYRGVGKVMLPCGATGEVDFFIQPTEGPELHKIVEVAHDADDLGDCSDYENKSTDKYHVKYVAACGISEQEALAADAFGQNETLKGLVSLLPRPQLTMQQWENSGTTSLANSAMKDFERCPVCRMVLDRTGWCDKCKEYREQTTTEKGNWWDAIVPNRFKNSAKKPNLTELDVAVVNEMSEGDTEYTEMYLCEVCGKYDEFDNWECGTCGDGLWCSTCAVGHKDLHCPRTATA